jgi:glutathione S-transferase
MADFKLYIGDKNYSSWSLRGWLMMKQCGAAFDEVIIPLEGPGTRTKAIQAYSPSGRVPALHHGDLVVWESLAIGEYLAEVFPEARLWPGDRAARAVARAVSAEMLSGFAALRSAMPMNVRRKELKLAITPAVADEIARIAAIWKECRRRFGKGGPFLFGAFSNADAMYAPVATRFLTYGVDVDAETRAYVDAVMGLPAMREWIEAARRETTVVEAYEKVGG